MVSKSLDTGIHCTSMSGRDDSVKKLIRTVRATQIDRSTNPTTDQEKSLHQQQLADTTNAGTTDHTTMDQANLGSTKAMKVVEDGETVTTLDSAVPKATQKKKRKNHRGGKKKKGASQMSAENMGDGHMEEQGSTKHDDDELVARDDPRESQQEYEGH